MREVFVSPHTLSIMLTYSLSCSQGSFRWESSALYGDEGNLFSLLAVSQCKLIFFIHCLSCPHSNNLSYSECLGAYARVTKLNLYCDHNVARLHIKVGDDRQTQVHITHIKHPKSVFRWRKSQNAYDRATFKEVKARRSQLFHQITFFPGSFWSAHSQKGWEPLFEITHHLLAKRTGIAKNIQIKTRMRMQCVKYKLPYLRASESIVWNRFYCIFSYKHSTSGDANLILW